MAGEWRTVKLGDILTLQRGFDLPKHNRVEGGVPVVSSSGMSGTHNEAKVQPPGVVTGRYGTIGQVYFLRQPFWPLNTTLWVKDFKGNDEQFCYYLLQTLDYFSCSDKAAVPGVNRNHLHELAITVPPLSEQRAIAHILGTLDNKIELNRRMNRTLEEMARAIFKSWFVDFDPVRAKMEGRWKKGESLPGLPADLWDVFPDRLVNSELGPIPEGWEVGALDQVADYMNGLACQKYPVQDGESGLPVIKIRELRNGISGQTEKVTANVPQKYLVKNGDILFSWSGSLLVRPWTEGTGVLNQHLYKVTSDAFPK